MTSAGKATGVDGTARLAFTATGLGQSVTATPVVTSSRDGSLLVPANSRGQVLLGGGIQVAVPSSDTAEVCPVEAEHHATCPCQHTGTREITVRWSAVDLPGWYRGTVTVDGVEAAHADLGAGGSGEATIRVTSGQAVTVGYAIYGTATRAGAPLYADVLDEWIQR